MWLGSFVAAPAICDFIDYNDALRLELILFANKATATQRNAHNVQVVGRYRVGQHQLQLILRTKVTASWAKLRRTRSSDRPDLRKLIDLNHGIGSAANGS
jgi:hypothetical protein